MEHFFSPNSSTDLRSDAHQSQIIGGDADEYHTQIVGRNTVKLLEKIYSPHSPPPGFGTPTWERQLTLIFHWDEAVYLLWWPSLTKDLQTEPKTRRSALVWLDRCYVLGSYA